MTTTRKTKTAPTSPVRCAIYTRKSTEEGLDQDFNSLDAQREAAEAYIHSQAHAGWTALSARYDDGGYSGSNLDRPALQRLLADIQAGQIDCVLHQVGSIHLPLQSRIEVQSSEQGQVIAIQLQELTERGGIASLGPPHQLLNIRTAAAHRHDPTLALDTKRPPFPPRRFD